MSLLSCSTISLSSLNKMRAKSLDEVQSLSGKRKSIYSQKHKAEFNLAGCQSCQQLPICTTSTSSPRPRPSRGLFTSSRASRVNSKYTPQMHAHSRPSYSKPESVQQMESQPVALESHYCARPIALSSLYQYGYCNISSIFLNGIPWNSTTQKLWKPQFLFTPAPLKLWH